MIKASFQLALLFVWLTQSTPVRTGDVARHLSSEDIAAIQRLLPSTEQPWLLNGDPGQLAGAVAIQAYRPPTTTTPSLRRGTVVTVVQRHIPPVGVWTVLDMRSYVQVAVPGRSFDDIQGDQDVNRPFNVIGVFDDDELVRLVELLRSDPTVQNGPVQAWPILSIQRKADDSVQVLLRGAAMRGQSITLRQVGRDWIIVSVGMWIV